MCYGRSVIEGVWVSPNIVLGVRSKMFQFENEIVRLVSHEQEMSGGWSITLVLAVKVDWLYLCKFIMVFSKGG